MFEIIKHKKTENMKIQMKILGVITAGLLMVSCGDSAKDDGLEGPFNMSSSVTKANEAATGFYGDIVYGDENAPVTIIEYASLTCSHCGTFHTEVLPQVKKELLDTGRAKLVFRNYVRDGYDLAGAAFARCEDDMEKVKAWHDTFFIRQHDWYRQGVEPTQELALLARKRNISRAKFDRCAINKDMQKYLRDMVDEASNKLNITATPSVFVAGMKLSGYQFEDIKKAVERAEK